MPRVIVHRTCLMVALAAVLMAPIFAQQAQPVMSRSKDDTLSSSTADDAFQGQAVATTRKATVGQHAILSPYEQCGGERGLCNTTTIGVPCGDHPWGLDCPNGYECQRKTPAMWQCYPVVGKADSADVGPTRFTTAPAGSQPAAAPIIIPPSNGTAPAGSSLNSSSGSDSGAVTPAVKACNPGEVSVGSRCFRSSGSSRKAVAGTLAGGLMLVAWQLAIQLVAGFLLC